MTTWALMIQPQAESGVQTLLHELDHQRKRLVETTDPPSGRSAETISSTEESASNLVARAAELLACQLAGAPPQDAIEAGRLVLNPTSQNLRVAVCGAFSQCSSLTDVAGIYARQDNREGEDEMVVDIPANGYLWLPIHPTSMITQDHAEANPTRSMSAQVIASEWQLGNEFLRARIDPESGGLAGLYAPGQRANRLSQRLFVVRGLDQPSSNDTPASFVAPSLEADLEQSVSPPPPSRMIAEDICIETNSAVRGAIVTRGSLLSADGRPLGRYRQRFELWRGMRHLMLEVSLQLLDPCEGTPWENYVASRVAWRSAGARLSGVVQEMVVPQPGTRFDSPLGFEIADDDERTWIQTAGLPFHRRVAPRQCDTILVCAGESEQHFRLRFCLDPPQPLHSALGAAARPISLQTFAPRHPHGWLVHLDARHVVMSDWRPVWNERRVTGLRVRLWESSGQMAHASLRAARPFQSAQKCDFLGEAMSTCPVEDGIVRVTLAPFEWTDLECHW
jgi:hypothetical protein